MVLRIITKGTMSIAEYAVMRRRCEKRTLERLSVWGNMINEMGTMQTHINEVKSIRDCFNETNISSRDLFSTEKILKLADHPFVQYQYWCRYSYHAYLPKHEINVKNKTINSIVRSGMLLTSQKRSSSRQNVQGRAER